MGNVVLVFLQVCEFIYITLLYLYGDSRFEAELFLIERTWPACTPDYQFVSHLNE